MSNYTRKFILAIVMIVLVNALYIPQSFWFDVVFFIALVFFVVKFFRLDKQD